MPSEASQWRPGQSGNLKGRPAIDKKIRELALIDTPAAYETVRALMETAEKDSVKLAAAVIILRLAGISLDPTNLGGKVYQLPTQTQAPMSQLISLAKQPSTSSGDGES